MRRWWFIAAVIVALGAVLLVQLAPGVFESDDSVDHPRRSDSRAGSRRQEQSSRGLSQEAALAAARSESLESRSSDEGADEAADAPGTLSLSGTVTDPEGRPLEGVSIQVEAHGNRYREMRRQLTTDSQGRFRLRSLVPGLYDLSFKREHFLPQNLDSQVLERDASPLAVALQPAPTIEGRVVDTAGNPLSGAELSVFMIPRRAQASSSGADSGVDELELDIADLDPLPRGQAKSGADGRFILDTSKPDLWRLTAELEGYGAVTRELASPARDVWLVLGAGAGVDATVVDEHDQPVRGAEVVIWKEAAPEPWQAKTSADEAGQARLRGLDPGRYIIAAMPPEAEGFRITAQRLDVKGETIQQLRLRFTPGSTISGVVVDRAGKPVPDVRIQAKLAPKLESTVQGFPLPECLAYLDRERFSAPMTTQTGPDGRFFIPHVVPFDYSLRFEKQGYIGVEPDPEEESGERRYRRKFVKGGDHDVRVVLTYQGRVSGRVVRADGEPVRSFQLNGAARESPDGTFTEETRGAGERTLRVLVPGLGGAVRHYDAKEGEDIDLGDLVLGEGRPVRILVEDAVSSRLLPLSRVRLMDAADREQLIEAAEVGYGGTPRTGLDGTCLLPDVPHRPLLLVVERAGYEQVSQVLHPAEEEVRVRLRQLASVQGAVRVAGAPMESGYISVLDSDGLHDQALDVKDGRYSGRVSPGRHIFQPICPLCSEPEPIFLPRAVEVPEPLGALTVDFDDVRTGATVEVQGFEGLSGLALVPGQQPTPTSEKQLDSIAVLGHPRSSLGKRLYRFRTVPAGPYTVLGSYERDDGTTVFLHEELEVPAEGDVRIQLHR